MRTREKTFCGRERPPFLALLSRQNPFGLRGSLPATVCAPCTRTSQLSCVRSAEGSCASRSTVLTCTTPSPTEEKGHASSEAARTHDRIECLLSLPSERKRNCEEPVKGRPAGAAPSSRP